MKQEESASPCERGKRLKRLRTLANLNRKIVEEKYGINLNTLKGWELGRHGGITEKGAKKILTMCESEGVTCDLNWLLYATGPAPILQERMSPHSNKVINKIAQEILFFHQNNKNATELMITDDSMAPCFQPGDYVAGVKRDNNAIDKLLGMHCIIECEQGTFLRTLQQSNKENFYNLIGCLEKYNLQEVKLISAAPVTWHRKKDPV